MMVEPSRKRGQPVHEIVLVLAVFAMAFSKVSPENHQGVAMRGPHGWSASDSSKTRFDIALFLSFGMYIWNRVFFISHCAWACDEWATR